MMNRNKNDRYEDGMTKSDSKVIDYYLYLCRDAKKELNTIQNI